VIVGAVAVTLDRAAKVQRDQFVQTLRLSGRVPPKSTSSPGRCVTHR